MSDLNTVTVGMLFEHDVNNSFFFCNLIKTNLPYYNAYTPVLQ